MAHRFLYIPTMINYINFIYVCINTVDIKMPRHFSISFNMDMSMRAVALPLLLFGPLQTLLSGDANRCYNQGNCEGKGNAA